MVLLEDSTGDPGDDVQSLALGSHTLADSDKKVIPREDGTESRQLLSKLPIPILSLPLSLWPRSQSINSSPLLDVFVRSEYRGLNIHRVVSHSSKSQCLFHGSDDEDGLMEATVLRHRIRLSD